MPNAKSNLVMMILKTFPFHCILTAAAALPLFGSLATGAVLTFDTANDFAGNFNRITGGGAMGYNNPGQYLSYTPISNTSTFAYDLNGSAAGLTTFGLPVGGSVTISADVRFTEGGPSTTASSSFGLFMGSYLGLLNSASVNETLRIGTNLNLTDGGVSGFAGSGLGEDLFTPGGDAPFVPVTAKMTWIDESSFSFSFIVGSGSYTQTIASAPPTDFQVGFRAYNVTGSTNRLDIDNFNVTVIPEPSAALLAVGSLSLLSLRRLQKA